METDTHQSLESTIPGIHSALKVFTLQGLLGSWHAVCWMYCHNGRSIASFTIKTWKSVQKINNTQCITEQKGRNPASGLPAISGDAIVGFH